MFEILDSIFEIDDMDMITFLTVFDEDELIDFDEYCEQESENEKYKNFI